MISSWRSERRSINNAFKVCFFVSDMITLRFVHGSCRVMWNRIKSKIPLQGQGSGLVSSVYVDRILWKHGQDDRFLFPYRFFFPSSFCHTLSLVLHAPFLPSFPLLVLVLRLPMPCD